jgi:5-methyltetrahydropteroyltriglutamate--homocysteine methyltransferase
VPATPDRILTTHVGSLPRPVDLLELYTEHAPAEAIAARLQTAVADVVAQQLDLGLDIVNDGEFGKPVETAQPGYGHGTWALYVRERLGGFEWIEDTAPLGHSKDRAAFSSFFGGAEVRLANNEQRLKQWTCTSPITYTGESVVTRDIANLRDALDGRAPAGAFLPVASPNSIATLLPNAYYESMEDYTAAIAEAMRVEYKTIVDAGFLLQIDDPALVVMWDWWFADRTFEEWRALAQTHIDLLNHTLSDIPEDRVRYHMCWGSWQGPHSSDVPLADVVDLILQIRAGAYSLEAANPRHEHEWRVWQDVTLPEGKVLIPGVVTHKTSVLEHPDVVADRIVRYAEAVGAEKVIAGTDCGMGGRTDPTLAWAKMRALVDGAALATKRLRM